MRFEDIKYFGEIGRDIGVQDNLINFLMYGVTYVWQYYKIKEDVYFDDAKKIQIIIEEIIYIRRQIIPLYDIGKFIINPLVIFVIPCFTVFFRSFDTTWKYSSSSKVFVTCIDNDSYYFSSVFYAC